MKIKIGNKIIVGEEVPRVTVGGTEYYMYPLNMRTAQERKGPALVSHPEYYGFTQPGRKGTWGMSEYEKALEELEQAGELEGTERVEPEHATPEDIALVHDPEYAEDVLGPPGESEKASGAWSGGPWDESAQKAVTRSTGGMLRANQEAMERGLAMQLYDAFHHAYPGHGGGFCVLNDVAIAAKRYAQMGHRVMVVDTDVHQGQGTAVCTADDPNIYTLSTHEERNYPYRKEESSLDIALDDYIDDDTYLELLRAALSQAIDEFGKPDLVMYVAGTDLYGGDRLSNTEITIEGIRTRDRMVLTFFGEMGVPVATSVPQGYASDPAESREMIKNTIREVRGAWDQYYSHQTTGSLNLQREAMNLSLRKETASDQSHVLRVRYPIVLGPGVASDGVASEIKAICESHGASPKREDGGAEGATFTAFFVSRDAWKQASQDIKDLFVDSKIDGSVEKAIFQRVAPSASMFEQVGAWDVWRYSDEYEPLIEEE